MTPQYKFTFYHSSLVGGSQVVNQPAGWRQAEISLERDEVYHSLVEYFKGSFMWYGTSLRTILAIEAIDGPSAEIGVLIEVRYRKGAWEEVFMGMLKLAQLEEISKGRRVYKMLCPIIRDDFWARFINRAESAVDLGGALDVDGNARTSVNKIVLPMPSQKIITRLEGSIFTTLEITDGVPQDQYVQFDNNLETVSEVEQKFSIGTYLNPSLPVNILTALYDGVYDFDLRFVISEAQSSSAIYPPLLLNLFIKKNDETAIALTEVNHIGASNLANPDYKRYTYSGSMTLKVNDVIRIYGKGSSSFDIDPLIVWGTDGLTFASSVGTVQFPGGSAQGSWIKIVANTTYSETTTDAYLIKDAAESILSKITGRDSVVESDLFSETGEGTPRLNAIMRGKHVRGYSMTDLAFSMSFKDWWLGAEPLLNLGLGYEKIAGIPKIRIEDKAYFYNPVPVVNIGNIKDVIRKYDHERFFKSVEVGFEKWSAESDSGIDDPQTKRVFTSPLSNFGTDLKIMSKWIAASLAIERSRRNRIELGKDDRLDEDILLVALIQVMSDYEPEFGTAFTTSDLLNPDFRINIRHTAVRVMKRWKNFINGSFQHALGTNFTFTKGEGNYKTSSEIISPTDYEYTGTPVVEDANHVVDATTLWFPKIYEVQFPIKWATYKLIVANREHALGLSRTEENFSPQHILDFNFNMQKPYAKATVLQATSIPL